MVEIRSKLILVIFVVSISFQAIYIIFHTVINLVSLTVLSIYITEEDESRKASANKCFNFNV